MPLPPDQPVPPGVIPFVESPLGLWVPSKYAETSSSADLSRWEEPPEILRYAIVTVGWHQLTGQTATIRDVVTRLERYSVRQIVGFVGRITIALTKDSGGHDQRSAWARQVRIANGFLGPEVARSLLELVRRNEGSKFDAEHRALFHERQALNALKIALIAVDVERPDAPEPGLLPFVEALLMLNDLIDPREGSMGPSSIEGQHAMELYFSANTLFYEAPAVLSDFVRAHYLYVEGAT